jgi:hypothetical protein
MDTTHQIAESQLAEFEADSQKGRKSSRQASSEYKIHYVGAKDPRVPLYVGVAIIALATAAAAYVIIHSHS